MNSTKLYTQKLLQLCSSTRQWCSKNSVRCCDATVRSMRQISCAPITDDGSKQTLSHPNNCISKRRYLVLPNKVRTLRNAHTGIHATSEPNKQDTNEKETIVVIGSGWGGFTLCKKLNPELYNIVCISPSNHFLFTPLLPQTTVGTLEFRCIQEPVRTIRGVTYFQAKARSVDFVEKNIHCEDIFKATSFQIKYDRMIIAAGSKTNTFGTPGVLEREGKEVFFLKHLYHSRQIRNRVLECFERAAIPGTSEEQQRRLLSFVIVGGGATSCEFCAELHDFIREDVILWYPDLKRHTSVHLIEAENEVLNGFAKEVRRYTTKLFKKRDIDVRTGVSVTAVSHEQRADGTHATEAHLRLVMHPGTIMIGTQTCNRWLIGQQGLAPVKFTNQLASSLETGPGGRIVVDEFLNVHRQTAQQNAAGSVDVVADADVWAIGDCAINPAVPLPSAAKVAQQHAQYLAKAFNAETPGNLSRRPVQPFRFLDLGSMVQLGMAEAALDLSHTGAVDNRDNKWLARVLPQAVRGTVAWLAWRSYYVGNQVTWKNKMLIPMHWFKSFAFGRDISRF